MLNSSEPLNKNNIIKFYLFVLDADSLIVVPKHFTIVEEVSD